MGRRTAPRAQARARTPQAAAGCRPSSASPAHRRRATERYKAVRGPRLPGPPGLGVGARQRRGRQAPRRPLQPARHGSALRLSAAGDRLARGAAGLRFQGAADDALRLPRRLRGRSRPHRRGCARRARRLRRRPRLRVGRPPRPGPARAEPGRRAAVAEAGAAAVLVLSFAPGAVSGRDVNAVFWRWGDGPPHRVEVVDDHGRLPRDRRSWS